MAVETDVPAHLKHWKEENLRNGLTPAEGIETFRRILADPVPQIVASPVDIQTLLELAWRNKNRAHETLGDTGEEADSEKTALKDLAGRPDVQSIYIPPSNETEKKMVEIWQELIGIEPIGIQDNFFELGGHSLLAIQILSRIRQSYQVDLSLHEFFETNTIAEICKRIDASLWLDQKPETPISTDQDREEFAL